MLINKTALDTVSSGDCEVGDSTPELSVLNNITETSKYTRQKVTSSRLSPHTVTHI